MLKQILKLGNQVQLWLQRTSEVARYYEVIVSDLRMRQSSPHFCAVTLAALQLVRETDPRRFSRIQRHIRWVVNTTLDHPGGQYSHATQTCKIDFQEPDSHSDYPFWVAWYASLLVHEATHGAIEARGIRYSPEFRARIERLCVAEQNRFHHHLARTQPDIGKRLHKDFDEAAWRSSWTMTPWQSFLLTLRRIVSQ